MQHLAMILAALLLAAAPAAAQSRFEQLFVIGDSLTDPGNIPELAGVDFPPPPYVQNHFSNGPTFAEILPRVLGAAPDPSTNFAVGGAQTGTENNTEDLGVALPGMRTQVDALLRSGTQLDAGDLIIVYGGANDIFAALETAATLPPAQIPLLIRDTALAAARNISAHIQRLAGIGGRFFVVPNLPDIGATPAALAEGPEGVIVANAFSVAHNRALAAALAQLQQAPTIDILPFDVNQLFRRVLATPQLFGFANVRASCIDTPACVTAPRPVQDRFLFFDGVHPTTRAHGILARFLGNEIRVWERSLANATLASRP